MKKRILFSVLMIFVNLSLMAQTPVLKVADKENPKEVYLQTLDIKVEVAGNIATTTMYMVFHNRTNKILEGELSFPLPEGVTVSGYALDINGKMRKAVPVEKAKATQVFEEIERRRVDPGLLEQVEGNNFRTRIYPIPGNGSRKISITYEQELKINEKSLRYYLPLNYESAIDDFSLQVTIFQPEKAPIFDETPDRGIKFDREGRNYTAMFSRKNYQPKNSLHFSLPIVEDIPEVLMQPAQGSFYFYVNHFLKPQSKDKKWGNTLGIIWDASLSAQKRDIQRELKLLDALVQHKKNLTISLSTVNYTFEKVGVFKISNGDWSELKQAIEDVVYDGGTNFSAIDLHKIPADEYLFFSDGLSTLSDAVFDCRKPLHSIVSSPQADYNSMKWLSMTNNGKFINLNALSDKEANQLLMKEMLRFLGIKPNNNIREAYPSVATPVQGNIAIAGIVDTPDASIVLQFGYSDDVIFEKKIELNADKYSGNEVDVYRIWAQKKIAEMDLQYEKNRDDIMELGKQFGIVTRGTSLMVLETIEDYITYQITPPEELREEYERKRHWNTSQQHISLFSRTKYAINGLESWWRTPLPKPLPKPLPTKYSFSNIPDNIEITYSPPAPSPETGNIYGVILDSETGEPIPFANVALISNGVILTGTQSDFDGEYVIKTITPGFYDLRISCIGYLSVEITEIVVDANESLPVGIALESYISDLQIIEIIDHKIPVFEADQTSVTTTILPNEEPVSESSNKEDAKTSGKSNKGAPVVFTDIKQDQDYMKSLTGNVQKDYDAYLQLRPEYGTTPSFYFDMSDWFYKHQDADKALLILSSIAELELENASLFKTLAYKLKEYGQYEQEVFICQKILQWRPMEPQSYRDLGLALADAGKYQQALDTLYAALTIPFAKSILDNSNGIESALVNEINNLISLYGDRLKTDGINSSILETLPVDVRVVINWNINNTDIDLHVTDPNGERCYYGNRKTIIGGNISKDNTRDYGPEEFLLKKAIPGKYIVEVDYYGDTRVKVEGPTTVMAELYFYYSTGKQERKVITLQMPRNGRKARTKVVIGEFEFSE